MRLDRMAGFGDRVLPKSNSAGPPFCLNLPLLEPADAQRYARGTVTKMRDPA